MTASRLLEILVPKIFRIKRVDAMWPYIWIAFMLALIVSVIVTAMREKKARAAAMKKLAPQPLDASAAEAANPVGVDDGFGEPDPLDSFGEDPEMADFDEKAFK